MPSPSPRRQLETTVAQRPVSSDTGRHRVGLGHWPEDTQKRQARDEKESLALAPLPFLQHASKGERLTRCRESQLGPATWTELLTL